MAEVLEALSRVRPGWTYALYLQSVADGEWDAMRMELERPAAGSPEYPPCLRGAQSRTLVTGNLGPVEKKRSRQGEPPNFAPERPANASPRVDITKTAQQWTKIRVVRSRIIGKRRSGGNRAAEAAVAGWS